MNKPSSPGHWGPLGERQQVEVGYFLKPRYGGGAQREFPLDSVLCQKCRAADVELQPLRDNGVSQSASLHPSCSSPRKST